MKQITVEIRTLSPVVLSSMSSSTVMTASHTYFSGSIIRGIFASRYIHEQGLGNHAEQDVDFLSLFFDKLRFTAAYPVSADGQRSFILPFSMQKSKDGKSLLDLLKDEGKPGFKSCRGFGLATEKGILPIEVRKTINLHMSRNDQKQKDGKERLAGRSLAGGIYNYEAIDVGQTFQAVIYGPEDALTALRGSMKAVEWEARVGRSRYTQYGDCSISLSGIEDIPATEPDIEEDSVCLRLDSPYLPGDALSICAEQALADLAQKISDRMGSRFSISAAPQTLFAKSESIENFVGVWNMKKPREQAIAAGSVFLLHKDEGTWNNAEKEILQEILYEGVGKRTEEGFGQLRIWNGVPENAIVAQLIKPAGLHHAVQENVQKNAVAILTKHLLSQVQVWAAEDVESSKGFFPENGAHFFSRLDALLGGQAKQAQENLRDRIQYEMGNDSTPFAKGLQKISVHDRKLWYYLTEANLSEMPYNQRDWQRYAEEMQLDEAMRAIGIPDGFSRFQSSEALFYTYWHWFFRYGRKAAAASGKGDEA